MGERSSEDIWGLADAKAAASGEHMVHRDPGFSIGRWESGLQWVQPRRRLDRDRREAQDTEQGAGIGSSRRVEAR